MKVTISKEDLLKGLQIVQNAVSSRVSLPILSNILVETQGDDLQLTATDLDIAISSLVPCEVHEKGDITIPAKKFFEVVREMWSDQPIEITAKSHNNIQIKSADCFFKLAGLPTQDFPHIPKFQDGRTITVAQNLLKLMLRCTSFAVSRDESRYVLNGVLFSFTNKSLRLVATDGRRLALIEKKLGRDIEELRSMIVPIKAVQEINRNLGEEGDVEIILKENQLQFKINETVITTRLIEGEFPNYEQVIPQKIKEEVRLDTQKLLSAARRASIFTSQESQSIRLDFSKNRLVISKNTPEIGEAREEIATRHQGGEITIGFNPHYLIDALKNIDEEEVLFGLIDPEKPGVIKANDDYTYIILPMQLTS